MRVYAVHDTVRAAVFLYVEIGRHEDGSREYLTRGGDTHDLMTLHVAPGCEAPAYAMFPRQAAMQVAAAIDEAGSGHELVTLETWGDFAALVERVFEVAAPAAG